LGKGEEGHKAGREAEARSRESQMTSYQSTCGPIVLTIEPELKAIIPDTWHARAVIDTGGAHWQYFIKAIGEDGAKGAALNLARHGCRDHGLPEPAGLDSLRWEPLSMT
jgi:hypothetical protein